MRAPAFVCEGRFEARFATELVTGFTSKMVPPAGCPRAAGAARFRRVAPLLACCAGKRLRVSSAPHPAGFESRHMDSKKARHREGNGLLVSNGAPFAKIVEPRYWRSGAPCSSGFLGPPKIATTGKGEVPRGASPFLLAIRPPKLGRGRSRSGSPARSPWPASGSPCRTWRRCPRACRRS